MPQTVDAVKVPVVAAGGIADARGIAAFALGAEGVQMGTVFLACQESGAHPLHREAILSRNASHTALTRGFTGRLARGIDNGLFRRLNKPGTPENTYCHIGFEDRKINGIRCFGHGGGAPGKNSMQIWILAMLSRSSRTSITPPPHASLNFVLGSRLPSTSPDWPGSPQLLSSPPRRSLRQPMSQSHPKVPRTLAVTGDQKIRGKKPNRIWIGEVCFFGRSAFKLIQAAFVT